MDRSRTAVYGSDDKKYWVGGELLMREHKKDCDICKECKVVYANGQWSFLGCYHPPYRGKWVCEIKDCPKESEG